MLRFMSLTLLWAITSLAIAADLRIQGSNTIGANLGPALVKAMLAQQGLHDIHSVPASPPNEHSIVGTDASGQQVRVDVAAHGSGTGFAALKAGKADLIASSRPIKDRELVELEALGDLKSPDAEQIIAIDGLAIILHPGNPLNQLNTEQLAQIFSGQISTWEALGGITGPIHLYARDEQSGTWEIFKELVLSRTGNPLSHNAQRFESSEQLSDAVSNDPQGIGFIGLPYIRAAKPVAIVDGPSQPMLPLNSLIASEDYPLSRRLYFYLPPATSNPWARALISFTQSAQGQAIVAQNGFVAQSVQATSVTPGAHMPRDYQTLTTQAQRLSVNFRFEEGSASLDNKARQDLLRVADYLKANGKLDRQVTLVGFGDAKDDPERAQLLSKLRAMAVRRELVKSGVVLREIRGYGAQMPVAANTEDEGRIKNRRVEVWVY
jgi:phosphate transport system substrate-binding protein